MPLLLKNSYQGVWFVKYRGTFIKVIPIIDVVLVLSLQESSRPEVFFKKGLLQTFVKFRREPATLLKKRLWHRYFPVNFANFLRTPFLQNTTGRLLLNRNFNIEITSRKNNHSWVWTPIFKVFRENTLFEMI